MNKHQEKVLVATLCGLVITAAAAYAVQPTLAAGYGAGQVSRVSGVANVDQPSVRHWPAADAQTQVWSVPNS